MFVTTKKSMHFLHSTRGCSGLHCTNQAATASSHRFHRCAQIRRVSVKSVGEYFPTETSVNSVNSVGGLAEGGVGMAGMPYPPKWVLSKADASTTF